MVKVGKLYDAECVMEKGAVLSDSFKKSEFIQFNSLLEEQDHVIAITHKGGYIDDTKYKELNLAEETTNNFEYRPHQYSCGEYDRRECYMDLYKISEASLADCSSKTFFDVLS